MLFYKEKEDQGELRFTLIMADRTEVVVTMVDRMIARE